MTLSIGDTLPDATFLEMGPDGPAKVTTADIAAMGKVALFALPGAYTGTCSTAHVPSFMAVMPELKAKGVDAVICLSANDPFVMKAWSDDTGAGAAGIRFLGDAAGDFAEAIGFELAVPDVGFVKRFKRLSMLLDSGKVVQLNVDAQPGQCEISAGQTLLAQI